MSELWDYSDEDGAEDGVDPAESEGAPAETAPQSRKHSGRSGLNFEAGVNISEASGDTSKKRGRKCAYRSDEEKKAARNASARKWRAKKKAGKEATSGSRANSACDSSGVDSDAAAALGSAAAPGMHAYRRATVGERAHAETRCARKATGKAASAPGGSSS